MKKEKGDHERGQVEDPEPDVEGHMMKDLGQERSQLEDSEPDIDGRWKKEKGD